MAGIARQARRVRGFLFDLDGTLVNTDHIHFQAWQRILQPLGRTINEQDYVNIAGRTNPPVLRELFPRMPEDDVIAKSDEKEEMFRVLAMTQIVPVDGLLRLLEFIEEFGLPKTIVTNAPRENVDFMLAAANLDQFFPKSRQVLGDECVKPKPFPDPYLRGLEVIECKAEETLAFEDSPAGASAAIAAGIHTVGILTTQTKVVMERVGCVTTALDFTDKELWDMIRSGHDADQ